MNEYELTLLIHPDLEVDVQPAIDKVSELIKSNGGEVVKEENIGKKRLAYAINKQDFAVYYEYELKLPSSAPAKISQVLNITDEVIRYLLVSKDERKEKFEKLVAEKKAKEAQK